MPTILIVDDEPLIVSTLKMALERGVPRARVITAGNADEALALLDLEKVDIVCSDQRMPGMLGIDLLVEARKRQPDVMRLMLTAFPDDHMAIRGINEAQLDHFFVKPIRVSEIVAKFNELIERAALREHQAAAFARSLDAARRRSERVDESRPRVGARRYPTPFAGTLSGPGSAASGGGPANE